MKYQSLVDNYRDSQVLGCIEKFITCSSTLSSKSIKDLSSASEAARIISESDSLLAKMKINDYAVDEKIKNLLALKISDYEQRKMSLVTECKDSLQNEVSEMVTFILIYRTKCLLLSF